MAYTKISLWSNNSFITYTAKFASPKNTGQIGQSSTPITWKPASFILDLKSLVLRNSYSNTSGISSSILKTSSEAPTMGGANELENTYGRPTFLRASAISLLAHVYPPDPPHNAFPRVELIISI